MSAVAPFVRAIVVTAGRPGFLAETLAALAAQDRPVNASHLVLVDGRAAEGRDLGIPHGMGIPVTQASATTFGEAVNALLSETPGKDEWLWLLHDDSAPAKTALSRMLAVTRKRRRAGVVGPAQVRWDDPGRLVSVGVTVSRTGRRLNVVDQDDLDQGQHDGREDVLAVGLAGALVSREAWERLGGTDPAYGPFGDSTDFCRRAWRAGYDVVVVPSARVRHATATFSHRADASSAPGNPRRNHARIRASEWYHALAWTKPAAVAPIALWALVSSVARAAVRAAAGEARLALADLQVPVRLAARLGRLRRSRAAIRAAGVSQVERPLLASWLDMARHVRGRELGAYEAWRAENRPSDVQRGELAALAKQRRWTLAVVAVILAAVSVALYGTWLAPLARGDMLAGSALGGTDVSVSALWARSWTGWSDAGFGGGSLDGTFAALMLPFALVPGGLAMGIGLLLSFSPLIAGLAAWAAAGAAVRSPKVRALVAIAWAVWPTLTASVATGRGGAVLAHILLPVLALCVARAAGVQRRERLGGGEEFPRDRVGSPTFAALAAVVLVAVTIAAPILLAPLVVAVVIVAASSAGARRRLMLVVLPALVVQGPALWQTWQRRGEAHWWSLLVREPGPALSSHPVSGWDMLWGVGSRPPAWPAASPTGNLVLTYLPGVALVAFALVAVVWGRAVLATRVGWVVAAAGVATAVLSQRTTAVWPSADGSAAANGWPGPGLSLLALGLMIAVAAAAGAPRLREAPPGGAEGGGAPPRSSGILVVIVAAVVAVQVTAVIWPGRAFGGDVHPTGDAVLPLVADLERASQPATRVLVLRGSDDGTVEYSVVDADGTSALLGRAEVAADGSWPTSATDPGDIASLAPTVAELAGAGAAGGDELRAWGIGVVVVAPGWPDLEASLRRAPDLSLIGASDLGVSWRVRPLETGQGAKVARAWLEVPDGTRTPLSSHPSGLAISIGDGADGRTLVLAVPADPRWWATLNGRPLAGVEADGRQAFEVGGRAGRLDVGFQDPAYRAWWWVGLIAIAWALVSAVPLQDRAYRRERK